MGIFRRTAPPAAVTVPVRAAAGAAVQNGSFLGYSVGTAEERALSLPTITRARSMLATMVGGLDLRQYTLQWNGDDYEKIYVLGESWMTRPDPKVTRQFIITQTVSDLMFYGASVWYVTSRYSTGFPASFQWLPMANISTPDNAPPQYFGTPETVEFNGVELDRRNVVFFIAPDQGIIYTGSRTIDISLRLDQAARRFALTEVAMGYLQQTEGSEPLSGEELADLASSWSNVRNQSAIGALNSSVKYVEFSSDPQKLQLTEARQHAALELSRLAGVPAYLVSAPTSSGMTYNNAQEQRVDLWIWGAKPYATAIAERLSMDDIIPRGRHVEFDTSDIFGKAEQEIVQEPAAAPQGATA
jgi:hypothetical protein